MSSLNAIPTQFQVISTHPELKIRYSINRWDRYWGFPSLFISIAGLIMITCFTIFQKDVNSEDISTEDLPTYMILMNIIFIPFLLYWIWIGSNLISRRKEVSATRDRLLIVDTCRLLGICSQTSISASGISHFELSLLPAVGSDDYDFWLLNVVNSRPSNGSWKLFLTWFPIIKFEKTINHQVRLCGYTISQPNEWLAKLLANFYDVQVQQGSV
jgi:hypothetical protein